MIINKVHPLNNKTTTNFSKVNLVYLIAPLLVLIVCFFAVVFFSPENNYRNGYISIQKEIFYDLNSVLSSYPSLQYNLTQLGDVILLFPCVAIFILYAPKLWKAIVTSSILSLIVSSILKKAFHVPRPAAIFDNDSFTIIGKTLTGHTSLPSGHSMTTFIVITLVLLAFMPQKKWHKLFWGFLMLSLGFIITFSRVGVGAHYPLDVIIGSTIGAALAIIGIYLNSKLNWSTKFKNNKYQFVILTTIIVIWLALVIEKIATKNLFITYVSLVALLITLYLTIKKHVRKKN